MPMNLGSVEAAAKAAEKTAEREDSQSEGAQSEGAHGTEHRHLYIVHNADAMQPAQPACGTEGGPVSPRSVRPPVRSSDGMLDRTLQGQIGRMLRDVFSDVSAEPVPDRFIRLLEALEAKEKQP